MSQNEPILLKNEPIFTRLSNSLETGYPNYQNLFPFLTQKQFIIPAIINYSLPTYKDFVRPPSTTKFVPEI